MLSEQVWDQKEWTRWSVTRISFHSNTLKLQKSRHILKASVFFRSRMRKVTLSLPATAPPSWSRCRCSTLQPKWCVPETSSFDGIVDFIVDIMHVYTCLCGVSAGGTIQSPGHWGGWRHHLCGGDCRSTAGRLQQTATERWDVIALIQTVLIDSEWIFFNISVVKLSNVSVMSLTTRYPPHHHLRVLPEGGG